MGAREGGDGLPPRRAPRRPGCGAPPSAYRAAGALVAARLARGRSPLSPGSPPGVPSPPGPPAPSPPVRPSAGPQFRLVLLCRGGGGCGALSVGPGPLPGGPFRRPAPGGRWSAARLGGFPAFGWDAPPAPAARPPPEGGLPIRARPLAALFILSAPCQGPCRSPSATLDRGPCLR